MKYITLPILNLKTFEMKCFFCLTFFLIGQFLSFGQKEIIAFEPITKKPRIKHLLANNNKDGVIGLSYVLGKKFYFSAIDEDGKVLLQKECVKRSEYKLDPQGAIATENQFLHFFESPQSRRTYGIINILDRKIIRPFLVPLTNAGEIIIGEIFEEDTYYRVCINKAQKKLVLHKFLINELKFKATYFDLSAEIVESISKLFKSSNLINPLSENNPISIIKSDNPIGLSIARNTLKLYRFSENKIALTMDGSYSTKTNNTELLIFDWETGEKEQYYFGQSTNIKDQSITNSIIYQKNLYQVSITGDHLYLATYEMEDYQLIKSYFYESKDKEIDIMESNLLFKTDGYTFANDFNHYNFSKQEVRKVLKKLKNGVPFLYPKPFNIENDFIMVVGSGMIITTSYMSPSMPGMLGGFAGSNNYDYQYILTSFSKDEFQPTMDALPNRISLRRRKLFTEKLLTPQHIHTPIYFSKNKKYGVVHYLRTDNLIKIVEM